MDETAVLYDFMERIGGNPRIGPSHISLFVAILLCYQEQCYRLPVSVYSRQLMQRAKISALGTYHKCMRDLREYGYIRYIPSYNPVLGSLVYL